MNNIRKIAAAAAAALISGACLAAEFSVSPVRIFMSPRDRAVAIAVVNEGDEEMVIQSEVFSWQQKPDGQDDLKPTEDLVLSPPIVKMAPKSRQVLRLLRAGPAPAGTELTYRLIVREVPEAKPPTKDVRLQVAIAFSLPVFITPPGAKRQLDCATERSTGDTVKVTCENKGTAYSHVSRFIVLDAKGDKVGERETGGYILPEIKRAFDVKAAAAIPAGRIRLQTTLDDGTSLNFDGNLQ